MIQKRYIERTYPYLLSGGLFLLMLRYEISPATGKTDGLLTAAISVSAILMGFLGTAKAMLLSFSSSRFAWMKTNPAVWKILLGYLRSAFRCSVFSCAFSLVILSMDLTKMPDVLKSLLLPCWSAVFVMSVLTFYRVVTVFFSLLESESKDGPKK